VSVKTKEASRKHRHLRVRKKVIGTTTRPRLAVHRSNRHISAQIIDDSSGHTLVAASTYEASLRDKAGHIDGAKEVGKLIAERAKTAEISTVVFDRGGNRYLGQVAALADAAREAGLEF
jgi:large subunit ribosomal protein L18